MPEILEGRTYKCRHCGEIIESLNYRSQVTEYEDSDLGGEERDCNDSDYHETYYECPHCNHDMDLDNDIIQVEEEDGEDEDEEREVNNDGQRVNNLTRTRREMQSREENALIDHNHYMPQNISWKICPKCQERNEIIEDDDKINCSNCQTDLSNEPIVNI